VKFGELVFDRKPTSPLVTPTAEFQRFALSPGPGNSSRPQSAWSSASSTANSPPQEIMRSLLDSLSMPRPSFCSSHLTGISPPVDRDSMPQSQLQSQIRDSGSSKGPSSIQGFDFYQAFMAVQPLLQPSILASSRFTLDLVMM
jgi:hypothetical protein